MGDVGDHMTLGVGSVTRYNSRTIGDVYGFIR